MKFFSRKKQVITSAPATTVPLDGYRARYLELAAAVWCQTREEFEADQIPHSKTVKEAADGARALVFSQVDPR